MVSHCSVRTQPSQHDVFLPVLSTSILLSVNAFQVVCVGFPVVYFLLSLFYRWDNQSYRLLMRFFCVACIGGGIIASAGFTYISHHNYPGGVALQRLQQTLQPEGNVGCCCFVTVACRGRFLFSLFHGWLDCSTLCLLTAFLAPSVSEVSCW